MSDDDKPKRARKVATAPAKDRRDETIAALTQQLRDAREQAAESAALRDKVAELERAIAALRR